MDLMLLLLGVAAFPVACLAFVLWMGVIEDSIPAGVARAVREPDPPPILVVPVRRTAGADAPGWWESVTDGNPAIGGQEAATGPAGAPRSRGASPALDIPEQRTPGPVLPAALPSIPAAEPLPGT